MRLNKFEKQLVKHYSRLSLRTRFKQPWRWSYEQLLLSRLFDAFSGRQSLRDNANPLYRCYACEFRFWFFHHRPSGVESRSIFDGVLSSCFYYIFYIVRRDSAADRCHKDSRVDISYVLDRWWFATTRVIAFRFGESLGNGFCRCLSRFRLVDNGRIARHGTFSTQIAHSPNTKYNNYAFERVCEHNVGLHNDIIMMRRGEREKRSKNTFLECVVIGILLLFRKNTLIIVLNTRRRKTWSLHNAQMYNVMNAPIRILCSRGLFKTLFPVRFRFLLPEQRRRNLSFVKEAHSRWMYT